MGPSFFSMSYEFKELFDYCKIDNPLKFNELNPIYTVYFADKEKPYTIYKDIERLAKEFEKVEPNFKKGLRIVLKTSKRDFSRY
jgi:phytoene desaturase